MKTTICVIGVYFGKLPDYFNLWLHSCKHNSDIDFLLVGDNFPDELPENVRKIDMTLPEFKNLADKKLGLDTALTIPYKCCDFKVVYGIIFEDYVKNYDFWGHCDFDLIFGDLRAFFTEDIFSKYDRVLPLGHLSLYRNTKECNERYKLKGSQIGDYLEIFTNTRNYAFDEWYGICKIYNYNHFPMYDKIIFADISTKFNRFRLALLNKNYKKQIFYYENGKTFRGYYKHGEFFKDEFIYIHFQKRKIFSTITPEPDAFYIGPDGFHKKEPYCFPTMEEIKKFNPEDKYEFFKSLYYKFYYSTILPAIKVIHSIKTLFLGGKNAN